MRESQGGFTLVELVVGAAVGAVAIGTLVLFASRLTQSTSVLDTRVQSQGASERLMERLAAEAASAWAIYVPSTDVHGNANADGHEVDFFSEDGSHRPYSWTYTFDAAHKNVTRYAFAPGTPANAGDVIGPVDLFAASMVSAGQIGAEDPLFAGATVTPVTYAFDASSSAVGGNALVRLQIDASGVTQSTLLASATAPTTFTVIVKYTPSPTPVITPTPTPIPFTPATP